MRRLLIGVVLLTLGSAARCESPTATEQAASVEFVLKHFDAKSGGFKSDLAAKPSLRATNAATKAVRYFGGKLTQRAAVRDFVKNAYDASTGGFAERGVSPDVISTAVGYMLGYEVGFTDADFPKSLEYLHTNAKTFEEVRLAAAAVEVSGQKPKWLREWYVIADAHPTNDSPRELGGVTAMRSRLGETVQKPEVVIEALRKGQRADGGFGKENQPSELDTTYRIMRALTLLKTAPAEPTKLRAFVAKCRRDDGSYATTPGGPGSVAGVYYAAIILHWLDAAPKP